MKKTIVSFGIVLGLFVVGMVLASAFPQFGIIFGSIVFVVSGFAIFKPFPKLRLSHRIFNGSLAFFVGFLTLLASLGMSTERNRLAELKELDPDRYTIEVARIEEETDTRILKEQE